MRKTSGGYKSGSKAKTYKPIVMGAAKAKRKARTPKRRPGAK
jgi:hypothetical protein